MKAFLFDQAPCGLFCFADDGTLLLVNDTLCELLCIQSELVTGKNVESIFTIPTRIFFQTHFFPMIRMQWHAEEIFMSLLTSGGIHIPVLVNARRIDLEGRTVTCCAFIHVPNRKQFEDEMIAARHAAEQALAKNTELTAAKASIQLHAEMLEQHMRTITAQNNELRQFGHAITHNLKEPLRKILMFTSKVQAESNSPSLQKLVQANEQMLKVVSGMQEYIWLNEKKNHFTDVDLDTVASQGFSRLRSEQGSECCELNADPLPKVEGDKEQLALLFYHIFSNAAKFSKGDLAIIRVNSTTLKQNRFRSMDDLYCYEDYVRIEIIDEGLGFESTYSDDIFELFRKLHYSDGQGLGLALCRKIVENHQGRISAESIPNTFTKITIWLPLRQLDSMGTDVAIATATTI